MTTRPVSIITPLGDEKLLFRSMTGKEELGRLFHFAVELLSKDASIDLSSLVGQSMTVQLELPGRQRYFNGVVSSTSIVGHVGNFALYQVWLRPWLGRLKLRSGCRTFRNLSVPDIIKKIFQEHGLTDFEDSLSGRYKEREFTVQYNEADFAFVSRLAEREGIYYFFRHEKDRHILVLADSYCAHETVVGYENVPYYPEAGETRRERDHIDHWYVCEKLTPTACVVDDYDFKRPRADLMAKLVFQHELAHAAREIYAYPGGYTDDVQGETYARVRLEEYNARREYIYGEGNVRGLFPGALFSLSNHPRREQNREYLVVAAQYRVSELDYESTETSTEDSLFHCSISSIPSTVQFRSESTTQKSRVQGPQTAVVVGKRGEEIWADQYGRVMLRFRWDREGKSNENASCWARVAQVWAGAGWGAIHIPRVGQEVIVDFLEGDPDQPIVVGCLYNYDNMPPYDLPINQTQSGIKSRSCPDGWTENSNELRFEDMKGSEQVYLQAERNLDTCVKNDETHTVGHDRTKDIKNNETTTIGGMRTETVEKEETITIRGSRTEEVGQDELITVHGARRKHVKNDESITVGGSRTEEVGMDETITICGSRTEVVKSDESITIGGSRTEEVGEDETITINGARCSTIKANDETTVGGGRSHTVASDDRYAVGGTFVVKAGQIELRTAGGSIVIDSGGKITISGVTVKVQGTGAVDVKANGLLSLLGTVIHSQ